MPEMPDYRTEPSASPEGDGAIAATRWSVWAQENLDPLVEAQEPETGYGFDSLAEADRDRMAARVIRESELIGFWVAWHRAGGFSGLERGGWDRSTIFRKIRRFRTYYGVHPDDARFPWMEVDWDRCWRSDRLVAMLWAYQRSRRGERPAGNEAEIWQPHWAPRGRDPHDLEGDDYWAEVAARQGRPGPIERALAARPSASEASES